MEGRGPQKALAANVVQENPQSKSPRDAMVWTSAMSLFIACRLKASGRCMTWSFSVRGILTASSRIRARVEERLEVWNVVHTYLQTIAIMAQGFMAQGLVMARSRFYGSRFGEALSELGQWLIKVRHKLKFELELAPHGTVRAGIGRPAPSACHGMAQAVGSDASGWKTWNKAACRLAAAVPGEAGERWCLNREHVIHLWKKSNTRGDRLTEISLQQGQGIRCSNKCHSQCLAATDVESRRSLRSPPFHFPARPGRVWVWSKSWWLWVGLSSTEPGKRSDFGSERSEMDLLTQTLNKITETQKVWPSIVCFFDYYPFFPMFPLHQKSRGSVEARTEEAGSLKHWKGPDSIAYIHQQWLA